MSHLSDPRLARRRASTPSGMLAQLRRSGSAASSSSTAASAGSPSVTRKSYGAGRGGLSASGGAALAGGDGSASSRSSQSVGGVGGMGGGGSESGAAGEDDYEVELTPQMLAELLGRLQMADGDESPLVRQQQQQRGGGFGSSAAAGGGVVDESGEGAESAPAKPSAAARGHWVSQVAHGARNAVVKILAQVVEFDFEAPFQTAGDGQAVGTGFCIDAEEGWIVTNAHVVESARRLWVTLPMLGEERFEAEVLGVCFDVDLALLRTDAPLDQALKLGDSDQVKYGQEVVTLGFPLGMESLKLTVGIISGRQEGLLQTDAALNPGNSGGPMLDETGSVIGINVAIVQGSNSVGFTIPVVQLNKILDFMATREGGVVHKPLMGALFTNTSEALLRHAGLDPAKDSGVYVRRCYEGFPLHNAGVRTGDILHSFDGLDLDNFGQARVEFNQFSKMGLDTLLNLQVATSSVEVQWSHAGKRQTATMTFEDPEAPGQPILPAIRELHPPYDPAPPYEVVGGLVLMPLTVNHLEAFHDGSPDAAVVESLTPMVVSLDQRIKPRVVVANVLVGSQAFRVGQVGAGALITEINGQSIATMDDVRAALRKPEGRKTQQKADDDDKATATAATAAAAGGGGGGGDSDGKKEDDGSNDLFITVSTEQGAFLVLDLFKTLRDEFDLADTYHFQVTPGVCDALADLSDPALKYLAQGDTTTYARAAQIAKRTRRAREKKE